MDFSTLNSCHRPNRTRVRFRCLALFILLNAVLITACSVKAEPFFPLLTKPKADSIRFALPKNRADTFQVNRFIQLGQFYVYKPESSRADLDSAFLYYKQAFVLSRKLGFNRGEVRSMFVLGAVQAEKNELGLAAITHNKAIDICRKMGFLLLEAEGWYYLGEVHQITETTIPRKIRFYTQSMELYKRAGKIDKQAYVLKRIADINYLAGNLEVSLRQLLEALRLYQSIHFAGLHHTYNMLVSVNITMGNYEDAIKYGHAAIETSRAVRDTVDLYYFYLQLGAINEQLNQHADAIKYHKAALRMKERSRDTAGVILVSKHISLNYLLSNRPVEAITHFQKSLSNFPPNSDHAKNQVAEMYFKFYLYKKDFFRAEKYLLKVIAYENESTNITTRKIRLYLTVGDFYIRAGKFEMAHKYLQQAHLWNRKFGTTRLLASMTLHHLMFKLDSAKANYMPAIRHYQIYKSLNDSIFNTAKSKQIASIQIQYDTKKKEQDNVLLRRINQVQKASLREKDFQRNAAFTGAVMLLLLSGLSYNQYRIKRRSNAQLQMKQDEISLKNLHQQSLLEEKEWLLKEIHHRVKNNLQTVMSLLESQSTYLENDALAAIKDSQHRVQAMSLIHQKLYLSDNVTTIDMKIYIHELVSYLRQSFNIRQQIRFQLDLEAISLDIAQAIPIGLILNESITNAIKYAFPAEREGIITLSVKQPVEGHFQLVISDNGVGLPVDFENSKVTSLGIRLMRGLSNEIGGRLTIMSERGTSVSVAFEMEKVFRNTVFIPDRQLETQS